MLYKLGKSFIFSFSYLKGALPVEYLEEGDEYRTHALFANTRQILAQYQQKRQEKIEDSLPFLYKPFTQLSPDKELETLTNIRSLIKSEKFEEAVSLHKFITRFLIYL